MLRVYGRNNPKANIFKLVHNWLCDSTNAKWVLVLDNVDDASFLLAPQNLGKRSDSSEMEGWDSRPLIAYIPRSQNGSILVTTRTRATALQLVEDSNIVTVPPMEKWHAVALLEKKLRTPKQEARESVQVTELAAVLEFMPLAIVQAAAYITQRAPRCSVREYLNKFQNSDHGKASLLNYEAGQLRRDREAKNSIIITWRISFDHIRRVRPTAVELLSLMSLLGRQGIPEALVRHREGAAETSEELHTERPVLIRQVRGLFRRRGRSKGRVQDGYQRRDSHSDTLDKDLDMLTNYSFVTITENGAVFEMHALVQLAMRQWLAVNGQLERWQQNSIKTLNLAFPKAQYKNWSRCEAVFPHAKSALMQKPKEHDLLSEWASLLYKMAWYAWAKGNAYDAVELAVTSMNAKERVLGKRHEETLSSMRMAGLAYNLKGQWRQAEGLLVHVMKMRRRKLGADHISTLTSMVDLAVTYSNQGRWKEAEELEEQVIKMRKEKLEADSPATLSAIVRLAWTYWKQGRWRESELLAIQVMNIRKKKLGADHPGTLCSMANLAATYTNQGRWKEAEELEEQVITMRKKKLGADHPGTLSSMVNLAWIYRKQGRWKEAEDLNVQVITMRKKKLGTKHPSTLKSMAHLAVIYRGQGRREEALDLMRRSLQRQQHVLGCGHPYYQSWSRVLAEWETVQGDVRTST
jgi:tetratricopeptide (TPR) repeat protein